MNRPRVTITTGEVGPSLLDRRYGFRPYQRRDYSDGLVMILESRETGETVEIDGRHYPAYQTVATVFIGADGWSGGWHRRMVNSPADIGALYASFRRGLVTLGLYAPDGRPGDALWCDGPEGYPVRRTVGAHPVRYRYAPDVPVRPGETGRSLV